uniref:Uncharacterized protein n=1 Tax=Tetranychus urticae TaxID=32264 RepID=T1K0Z5_TETUR
MESQTLIFYVVAFASAIAAVMAEPNPEPEPVIDLVQSILG